MKKTVIALLIALALLIVGSTICGYILLSGKLSLRELSFSPSDLAAWRERAVTTYDRTVPAADVSEIRIDVQRYGVTVGTCPGEEILLTYDDYADDAQVTAAWADGKLEITEADRIELFSFRQNGKMTLLVPEDTVGQLSLTVTTGTAKVRGLTGLSELTLQATTGGITAENCGTEFFTAASTTGKLVLSDCTAKEAAFSTTTGGITAENLAVTSSLFAKATTGKLTLSDCTAGEAAFSTTTGGITAENLAVASSLFAKATTGNITLSLAGPAADFSADAETTTGKIELSGYDAAHPGEKPLHIRATTGNIRLSFAG